MPPALAELCVRAASQVGDVVMDPFCGSGTTGAAAVKLTRKFVGVDLLKRCVDEARQSLRQAEAAPQNSGWGTHTGILQPPLSNRFQPFQPVWLSGPEAAMSRP